MATQKHELFRVEREFMKIRGAFEILRKPWKTRHGFTKVEKRGQETFGRFDGRGAGCGREDPRRAKGATQFGYKQFRNTRAERSGRRGMRA